MKTKQIELTKEQIEGIKEIIGSGESELPEDELNSIRELKKQISTDDLKLAILYVKCYNFLELNSFQFINEEHDYTEEIKSFLEQFEVDEIRNLVNTYGNGKEYGDHIIELNVKSFTTKNRTLYNKLIVMFFRIVGVED